jgi:hypothetical protein
MRFGRVFAAVVPFAVAAALGAPASTLPSRAQQESAFLKVVDAQSNADAVAGNLMGAVGKHVDYECWVEQVVREGIMIGQCGNPDEPIDVFVKLPTDHLKIGDHLRVLGVIEQPAVWADVTGHPVYYAFMRAVFVDRMK